jgi:hypothetical protein
MGKEEPIIAKATLLQQEEIKMQQQPVVCGQVHATCNLNPKCTCTTTVDARGYHQGTHTSPFHVW